MTNFDNQFFWEVCIASWCVLGLAVLAVGCLVAGIVVWLRGKKRG